MSPLYFIADPCLLSGHSTLDEIVDQAVDGGARLIQYRDKNSPRRTMYENAKALREVTDPKGATLLINDYIDLALAVSADGVHLGQDDLPVWVARKLLGKNAMIGVSTHTPSEAIQAESEGADYIGFGPVFATQTKENARFPVGIEVISEIKRQVQIPLVAIGGVTLFHLPAIFAAGADGVAAISAFSGDVRSRVEEWLKVIYSLRPT